MGAVPARPRIGWELAMSFALVGVAALEAKFSKPGQDFEDGQWHGAPQSYMREHQVPIVCPQLIPVSGAAVGLTNDQMGPMTGWYWSIRRLEANGFTAGTVAVYKNAVQTGFGANAALTGELLFTFPQAGTYTFGRREMLLNPDDNISLVCTGATLAAGITGITVGGAADQFPTWYLPHYGS